jgi:thiol-disulfide isomerase/thioredoxin
MRISRSLGAISLLLAVAFGSAFGFAFDVREVLEEFRQKREALFASGAAPREEYEKLVEDTVARIDVKSLDADGLLALAEARLVVPSNEAAVKARLETLMTQGGEAGFLARLVWLNHLFPARGDEAATARFEQLRKEVMSDPRVPSFMRSERAPMVVRAAFAGGKEGASDLLALGRYFDAQAPWQLADVAVSYYQAAAELLPDDASKQAMRERLVEFLRGAGDRAKAGGASASRLENYEVGLAMLDGPAARGTLVGGPAPRLDFEWASRPGLRSMHDLKGKVVVLDFWATWCGPCVSSFPQVKALTDHYAGYDVEVVGVTSLQGNIIGLEPPVIDTKGDPQKEYRLMAEYMKAKDINWTVAFSRQRVFNPDYGVRGIPFVAIIDAEGRVRHVGLHPNSPLERKTALIDPLLREAGKRVPGAK